ncbi:3-deoxy-D-manno-octulosonate cytidylyltransferase [Cynara cardunculus var. scolymus]|uniref:3-deoxy-manno-octulosonate cytidylyltransferase n=1 Tax=Cynara cardunculus var. scolymus TaxID=59895 RepID=A0A103XLS6_CYNCS|nr:3-deoxy-D-manno-octulosonate cytidylyltransferase [Cynara cardunculus var. scolymus]
MDLKSICTSSSSSSSAKLLLLHGLGVAVAVAVGAHAYSYYRQSTAKFRSRVVGIIPARFASSRFEGKPLVMILGKPMIQRTWERAKLATTLDHVVVATDDEKIADCCRGFGADVIMTAESCRNGAERCSEALEKLEKQYDIVVNIQGDEPLIEPEVIDGIVKALQTTPDAVFSTAVTSLKPEDAFDPNRVKCVVDNRGYAIYFSRGLIPFNKSGKFNGKFPYNLHLGIQIYLNLAPTSLQLEEDLEQLKVLENGYKMKVHSCSSLYKTNFKHNQVFDILLDAVQVIHVDHDAHGVDTPKDVTKIESFMRERNLS